ncbi:MAG TPA: NosD domain-containing protein [bacterium]
MKTQKTHHSHFSVALMIAGLVSSSWANTYVVTHTGDTGAGSLRQAMTDADTRVGPDTVVFNIPKSDSGYDGASGTWTIRPLAKMRNLVWDNGTAIDGTSQAKFIGGDPNPLGPEIVIDGSLAGETDGFEIYGAKHALKGLVIHGFRYVQVYIMGDSMRVSGCYIGTDAAGKRFAGYSDNGISIQMGSWNHIGGESPEDRNVISGLGGHGIHIQSHRSHSHHNRIVGNYIGLQADGLDSLGNNGTGVLIDQKCHYTEIGPGNVISGNQHGIYIIGDSTDYNTIKGNWIGTDPSGMLAWGNSIGIVLVNTSNNTVGGTLPGEGNVVSGNTGNGIEITMAPCHSNTVVGNKIGVDVTGVTPLGNGESGIDIKKGAGGNRIGDGTTEGANTISGNGKRGIILTAAEGNRIEGNFIGTGTGGTVPAGNGQDGIAISSNSKNTVVGRNAIAYNGESGISIFNANSVGHTITQNSIYENQQNGIRTFDGGNLELPPPVLSGISPVSGTTIPNGHVEVFSDSSDEGRIYEGFTTADGSGNFTWSGTPTGPNITATVTDAAGNTSAFSIPKQITAVEEKENAIPAAFSLSQNFPNPFNPATTIFFDLPSKSFVSLKVFDLAGREVATLLSQERPAGRHSYVWNAAGMPCGVYFCRMQAGSYYKTMKFALLK